MNDIIIYGLAFLVAANVAVVGFFIYRSRSKAVNQDGGSYKGRIRPGDPDLSREWGMEVAKKAKQMRDSGLTLREISRELADSGYVTKSGKAIAKSTLSCLISRVDDCGAKKPDKEAVKIKPKKKRGKKPKTVSVLTRPGAVKLREWRKENNVTQQELCEYIDDDVDMWHISAYELLKKIPDPVEKKLNEFVSSEVTGNLH